MVMCKFLLWNVSISFHFIRPEIKLSSLVNYGNMNFGYSEPHQRRHRHYGGDGGRRARKKHFNDDLYRNMFRFHYVSSTIRPRRSRPVKRFAENGKRETRSERWPGASARVQYEAFFPSTKYFSLSIWMRTFVASNENTKRTHNLRKKKMRRRGEERREEGEKTRAIKAHVQYGAACGFERIHFIC